MQVTQYTRKQHTHLPAQPGVYKFYNTQGNLIYVGKAKNLKKRVSSYFSTAKNHFIKTRKMVTQINTIACVIVNNEYEALILENNLIKQHQPRYNILLKDSKTYPYLCITKEPFPRLILTRQKTPSLGHYFGPFTSTNQLDKIQELIRNLYPLRTCHYHLSQENIQKNKYKVCLAYHLGNCQGPCAGHQSEKSYDSTIAQVTHLLKGNFQPVKKKLKSAMLTAAKAHQFDRAQQYKEKLQAIENYQARSILIHPRFGNIDVIALIKKEQRAFISYFYIKKGVLIFAETVTLQQKLEKPDQDMLSRALLHFRQQAQSEATTILTNQDVATPPKKVKIVIPQVGDRRKLLDMAIKNAYLAQKEAQNKQVPKLTGNKAVLQQLQKDLQLKKTPLHIECFDNSNLQGTNPVAGMVCFKQGKPAKKDYRHFHIKTVTGPDDFASMQEVVHRRYQRLIQENKPLPDLIIIDGGKGQLGAAVKALEEVGVQQQIDIIAIAKKLEAIFIPNDPLPIFISKKSPSLKLLQRIRNATHDFALRFHKKKRQTAALQSSLENIPGLGPKSIQKLFTTFGSLQKIKEASPGLLAQAIGKTKAQRLIDGLH